MAIKKYVFPLTMVMFHSYANLPEGRSCILNPFYWKSDIWNHMFPPFLTSSRHVTGSDFFRTLCGPSSIAWIVIIYNPMFFLRHQYLMMFPLKIFRQYPMNILYMNIPPKYFPEWKNEWRNGHCNGHSSIFKTRNNPNVCACLCGPRRPNKTSFLFW